MKLAVIGSRTFKDYELMCSVLNPLNIDLIVSGGAKGADSLAERWAKENRVQTLIFHPNWDTYGKKAGIMRNFDIIDSCDQLIAFWDQKSKGTKQALDYARKIGKGVKVYAF
jgi:hypothetical protein